MSKYGTIEGDIMKKSERLNQELIFLSNKSTFHLKDIMQAFNISKRTALRDIQELEAMGLALYVENGRYGGYKLLSQNLLTPIYFNNNEILAIFFALKALDILSTTPFEKSYDQIKEKLFASLPEQKQKDIAKVLKYIHYYNATPINNAVYLEQILTSIMSENSVYITYTQYKYEETEIQIYDLFYRNGIWFCSAYDLNKHTWGTYRCDYIVNLEVNEVRDTFSRQTLEDIKQHHEETFNNIPFKCKLTTFGVELFLKKHYPNMKLEYIENSPYIVGGYNNEELGYMTDYLISLGEHVEIVYPEQLKRNYITKLNNILKKYE